MPCKPMKRQGAQAVLTFLDPGGLARRPGSGNVNTGHTPLDTGGFEAVE